MKEKLNLTIEKSLIPRSKAYARSKGISVSTLVEKLLRNVTDENKESFSQRWAGKFSVLEREDERYKKLKERYL